MEQEIELEIEPEIEWEPTPTPVAWMCAGLALLMCVPLFSETGLSMAIAVFAGLGLIVWTHLINIRLDLSTYVNQVLVFNLPIVVLWGLLAVYLSPAAFIAPAVAAFAVCYSFSYGAVSLYAWIESKPRWVSLLLIIVTMFFVVQAGRALIGIGFSESRYSPLWVVFLVTLSIIFQRLLALKFDDNLLILRIKILAMLGIAYPFFAFGFSVFLPKFPAMVIVGIILVFGAAFTVLASVAREYSSDSTK